MTNFNYKCKLIPINLSLYEIIKNDPNEDEITMWYKQNLNSAIIHNELESFFLDYVDDLDKQIVLIDGKAFSINDVHKEVLKTFTVCDIQNDGSILVEIKNISNDSLNHIEELICDELDWQRFNNLKTFKNE